MRRTFYAICFSAGAVLCVLVCLFAGGCGTSSSYSVHTIPKNINGTWSGEATYENIISFDLRLLIVQTEETVVVAYVLENDTGSITGTYISGNLEAANGNIRLSLLFMMNTATGTLTIGEDELTVKITREQE